MRPDVLAMAGMNLSDVPMKFPVLLDLGCRLLLEVPVWDCPLLRRWERGTILFFMQEAGCLPVSSN